MVADVEEEGDEPEDASISSISYDTVTMLLGVNGRLEGKFIVSGCFAMSEYGRCLT